jgi:hypothetical protein
MKAPILRQGFAVAVYSWKFIEDIWGRKVTAMREGMNLGGYDGIPTKSQCAGRAAR